MLIKVLGSGAGGIVPKWNRAWDCERALAGAARARTQCSIAVSSDGLRWFLFGATSDVRAQIDACDALEPCVGGETAIAGVVLANGDLEACAGLLSLREGDPLRVLSTGSVKREIGELEVWTQALARHGGKLAWDVVRPNEEVPLRDVPHYPNGLSVVPIVAPNVPRHVAGKGPSDPEANVGFWIREEETGTSVAFFPSLAYGTPEVERVVAESDLVLFDGTFWSESELADIARAPRSTRPRGHWPLSGDDGSLRFLASAPTMTKVLIHVNDTNPILDERSVAYAAVDRAGIEIAFDGMELRT